MGKIRSIKPEFFTHEGLFELESETGLPIRAAFIGLWCQCDREGRFRWKPRQLKLHILPWDDCSMDEVLLALESSGYVVRYAHESEEYGSIPTWDKHQVVNNKEQQSRIPAPETCTIIKQKHRVSHATASREDRVSHATPTPLDLSEGELEGKGREMEMEMELVLRRENASIPKTVLDSNPDTSNSKENAPPLNPTTPTQAKVVTKVTNLARGRAELHRQVHGVAPLSNAMTNGMLANLVKLCGEELAVDVLRYFYTVPNNFYRDKGHDLKLLINDLEKLTTEVKRQAPILKDGRSDTYKARVQAASNKEELMRRAKERGEV